MIMVPVNQNISSYRFWTSIIQLFEDSLNSPNVLDAVSNQSGEHSLGLESFIRDNHLVFRIAIPGIEKDDINIAVVNDHMTIKGDRKTPAGIDQKNVYLNGFHYGPFELEVPFPENVDSQEVTAIYNNGILEISVVLCKAQQPRVIEVQNVGKKIKN